LEQVRIDRTVVGLDEHRLGVAQQFALLRHEGPIVAHKGGVRPSHRLGDRAGLACPTGRRHRYANPVDLHRGCMDHRVSVLHCHQIEHRQDRGEQLTGSLHLPVAACVNDLNAGMWHEHCLVVVSELMLEQRHTRPGHDASLDLDVRNGSDRLSAERAKHCAELVGCRCLALDSHRDEAVYVELQQPIVASEI
jgi:hypothetical protein